MPTAAVYVVDISQLARYTFAFDIQTFQNITVF